MGSQLDFDRLYQTITSLKYDCANPYGRNALHQSAALTLIADAAESTLHAALHRATTRHVTCKGISEILHYITQFGMSFQKLFGMPQIFRCVNSYGCIFNAHALNLQSVFQCAQLLKLFGLLKFPGWPCSKLAQGINAIDIQSYMTEIPGCTSCVAVKRDGGA